MKEVLKRIERIKGQRQQVRKELKESKKNLNLLLKDDEHSAEAYAILKQAAKLIQYELQAHLGEITSLALEGVFDNPYILILDFVERRNTTECDVFFGRDGHELKPEDASGYGAVDIASLALRVASLKLKTNARPCIILDEPLKNLDNTKHHLASDMLQQLSKKLEIQFIIVTHMEVLTEFGDAVFQTTQKKGVSKVKRIEMNKVY